MQVKLLLTLLFITILAFIISSGCGGGSGTTQTSSLVTPTPNMTDNMAYITIKVKWPEQGMAGKLSISSKDEKDITASMPNGTNRIDVKVYNFKDKDPNAPVDFDPNSFLAGGYVVPPYTTTTIPVPIKIDPNDPNSNILPAIPVKIWAGAFGASGDINDPNSALLSTEHYMILRVGNQTANLQLGNYDLTLTADPNSIVLGVSTVSGSSLISNVAALPTPTPGRTVVKNNLTPMNPCMAEITPEGSPLPTDTPTPTPTPIRVYADITATLMIKYPTPTVNPTANTDTTTPPTPTPKFVANKRITFTLIQGNDEGTTLSLDGTTDPNTVSGTTNNNGTSTAKLSTSTAGDKVIKASFQADLNDPNSIYTKYTTISVAVTTPTPTPTRVGTAIVVPNLSGNWKHTGVGARYTINQHGTDLCYLTFTRIDAGTPTPSPEPTNTPASYPTSTPRWNSYWEGTWNGILTSSYNNSMCVSMYPNNTEHVTGYISNNNNTIDWYGTDSKIHYSRWVRE